MTAPGRAAPETVETGETKIAKAREAVTILRDFARTYGMHYRQRDPLVMAIHEALDLAVPPAPLCSVCACAIPNKRDIVCNNCFTPATPGAVPVPDQNKQ